MGRGLYKGFIESALFLIKDNWTQGAIARNAEGKEVQSYHPQAVCWSGFGALCKAVPTTYLEDTGHIVLYESMLVLKPQYQTMQEFENNSTHEEVLAAFDLAIKACDS